MYIVTGGAGFIGSVLISKLNEQGIEDILIVDRLRDSKKWLNLRSLRFLKYIHSDELFIPEQLEKLAPRIKGIFHMGACSSTWEMNMDYLMKNNVEYSKRLFQLATKLNVPFVYASSAATYGDGELGYCDTHSLINQLKPLNPYGYSKHLFDQWVLKQEHKPAIWFGVKFFNVFGPNEYHKGEMRSLVHKAFGQIQESGTVKLFKSHKAPFQDGQQQRDFIYVKDAVNVLIKMMESTDSSKSAIYNLGTGVARSFKDLVLATYKACGRSPQIEFIDMPVAIRPQYQYFTQADTLKLRSAFPNISFQTLETSVDDYVRNHLLKNEMHAGETSR